MNNCAIFAEYKELCEVLNRFKSAHSLSMVDATVYIPRIRVMWEIKLSILAKCWEKLEIRIYRLFFRNSFKGIVQRKLRWVKNDRNRRVSYCFNYKEATILDFAKNVLPRLESKSLVMSERISTEIKIVYDVQYTL